MREYREHIVYRVSGCVGVSWNGAVGVVEGNARGVPSVGVSGGVGLVAGRW